MMPAAAVAATAPPGGNIDPSQALAVLQASHPELLAPSLQASAEGQQLAPTLQTAPGSDAGAVVAGSLNGSEISGSLADGFSVSSPAGSIGLVPQSLGDVSSPTLVNGSAALFADTQPSTDVLLRPTPLGVGQFLFLRAADAPEQFSWQVSIGPDQQLVQLPDGSVAITDPMLAPTAPPIPTLTSVVATPITAQNNADPELSGAQEDDYPEQPQPVSDPADIVGPSITPASTQDLGHGCLVQAASQLLAAITNPLLSPLVTSAAIDCPTAVVSQIVSAVQDVLKQTDQAGCSTAVIAALTTLIAGAAPGSGSASCGQLISQLIDTLQTLSASLGTGPADTSLAYNVASSELQYAEQQTSDTTAAVISPPKGVDANGNAVATSLSITGDEVTLTVAHDQNTAYPVLAHSTVSSLSDQAAAAAGITYRPTYGLSDVNAINFTDTPNLTLGRTAGDVANWEIFKNKLPVRTARQFIAWDQATGSCPTTGCPADAWVTNVEHEGFTPYLDIAIPSRGPNAYKVPSLSEYRTHFTAILNHFEALAASNGAPPIRLWQSWNEPDNYTGGVRATTKQAADFWRVANQVLTSYCKAHAISGCTMVAGEFAHVPRGDYGSGGYVYEYGQELLRRASGLPSVAYPKIWGYHAYTDMENGWRNAANGIAPPYKYPSQLKQECTTDLPYSKPWQQRRGYDFQQTDCYVNYFAGTVNNGWDRGSFWHHPHVWLGEQGNALRTAPNAFTPLDARYVKTAGDPNPKKLNPNYPAQLGVSNATQRETDGGNEFLAFGARYKGEVTHIYYYAWGPGGNPNGFDSALEDWTAPNSLGVGGHVSRPVFCALTNLPIASCPGQRTAGPDDLSGTTPPPIYGG
ncbi:MAG: hypothetical protein M3065_22335 [Actinomycetota bacterium]|nr:hypothetical protein [Actinomycetota bacterium]